MAKRGPTPSQTIGPFFAVGLRPGWPDLAQGATAGERIVVEGQVIDGDGRPVPDAMLEIWQADAQGRYPRPQGRYPDPQGRYPDPQGRYPDPQGRYPDPQGRYPDPQERYPDPQERDPAPRGVQAPDDGHAFRGFGRVLTDAGGNYRFTTIKPGRVPGPTDVLQAPHLNLTVFARGLLRHLTTRIYFADDPATETDPILASVSDPAARRTLLARREAGTATYRFDVILQGEGETAFFDV